MPVISVIIPAYNVETYLGKCLESALKSLPGIASLIRESGFSPNRTGALPMPVISELRNRRENIFVFLMETIAFTGIRLKSFWMGSGALAAGCRLALSPGNQK